MSSSSYTSKSAPWNVESWSDFQSGITGRHRSSSFAEHAVKPRSIDLVMEEFRMNGFDSPYDPEDDLKSKNIYSAPLMGMGPSAVYLRQKSWPAPEASPTVPLPALGAKNHYKRHIVSAETAPEVVVDPLPTISEQQLQVLNTLPNSVLYYLLKMLEQKRDHDTERRAKMQIVECRFCKNNGELESRYRSHRLRWKGRVVCPVLRAYCCRRCGARGDAAHTLKYCPLTTEDERKELAARMRSVHNRRRNLQTFDCGEDVVHNNTYNIEPLDPIWEALANKLMF